MKFLLDIGGEGRHRNAWNLNPSALKTLGPEKGKRIPKRIAGRGDAIPLVDCFVDCVIVERTPLRRKTVHEILRVLIPCGSVILRHCHGGIVHPHAFALQTIHARVSCRKMHIGTQQLHETCFQFCVPRASVQPALQQFGNLL